jgi:hypothetical protein
VLERSAPLGELEQLGHEVGGRHRAEAACRGQRGVAVSGCDVEDALAGQQVEALAQLLAGEQVHRADPGEVAGRPDTLLTLRDRAEVEGDCGRHACGA